jgi:gamma-glutamyltranspeptidase/glutathione hydrolase
MPRHLTANTAAVATGHPLGAAAGLEVLEQGGNAVDASVAAMLALCVVIPGSVGLGGYGGSAVIFRSPRPRGQVGDASRINAAMRPTEPVIAIDFDSQAPRAFRPGMVTADRESSYYGAKSVTVPAVVAGLSLMLREYGTKSWSEVSQPAIRFAEDGFDFDAEHKRCLDRCAPHFSTESLTSLFNTSALPNVGDRWRQPDLARLLQQLADDGPASFYEGAIATSIVGYLRERGGLLSEEDFRAYRPQVVSVIRARCRDCELFTPPPPSGGLTSLAAIQSMEALLKLTNTSVNATNSPQSGLHFLAEALKHCWHERHQYLGDPEHVPIPFDDLLSEQAANSRAERILSETFTPEQRTVDQSPHTANVIAIDGDGNMVSLTATQGWMYGSHLVVDGLGLVLNHGMSRFDYTPGSPNEPSAGKRMQHNMSPMLALRNGQPAFAFGMPGGPKIVSVTAQVALNSILFGKSPAECITAPRIHTEGNEPLQVSADMPAHDIAALERHGHTIRREDDMGGPVNVLVVEPDSSKIHIASGEGTGAVAGF